MTLDDGIAQIKEKISTVSADVEVKIVKISDEEVRISVYVHKTG